MKRHNFTLTEVMAVMTIIVIMLSIGVSGYRNISSQVSLKIESADVISRVKSAVAYSLKSKTPTIMTIQTGETLSEKSYFFGGKMALIYSFNFDHVNDLGEWKPQLGYRSQQLDPPDIVEDNCLSSDFGMALDLRDSTDSYQIENALEMSKSGYGFYVECKVKLQPKAQDAGVGTLIEFNNSELYIKKDGKLASRVLGKEYPVNANIDIGHWMSVGHSITIHQNDTLIHQFVDGKLVGQGNVTGIGGNFGGELTFGNNFNGLMDEIKVYDVLQGEILDVDPKAGFLTTGRGGLDSISSIVVDGEGKLRRADGGVSDFVGFASSSIYGDFENNFRFNKNTKWKLKGSKLSLPEDGYLLLYNKTPNDFELVKYDHFDGSTLVVEEKNRALGGSNRKGAPNGNEKGQNYKLRLVYPVILSKNGGVY